MLINSLPQVISLSFSAVSGNGRVSMAATCDSKHGQRRAARGGQRAVGSARRAARGGHTSTSGFLGIKLVPTLDGSLCTGDSVVCTSWNDVIVLLRGGRSQSSRAQAFFSVEHIWSGQTVAVWTDRFGLCRPFRSGQTVAVLALRSGQAVFKYQ